LYAQGDIILPTHFDEDPINLWVAGFIKLTVEGWKVELEAAENEDIHRGDGAGLDTISLTRKYTQNRIYSNRQQKGKMKDILDIIVYNSGDVGSKTTYQIKKQMGKYVLDLKHYIKML
jgi:hypothetical protein